MKSAADTFADRLYLARIKRDMTMDQLSAKSGISQASISRFEQGRHEPSIGTANQLAYALEVDACWLAYGTGNKPDWNEHEVMKGKHSQGSKEAK